MKYVLLILCAVMVHAEELATPPVSPLLPDAVKLLAAVDKDVAEIEAKALANKYEAYTAIIPKLVKAQETATKAGKLDAANATKAKVEEYKAKVAEIVALRPVAETRPLTVLALGAWNMDPGYTITLDKGGGATWSKGAQHVNGGWSVVGNAVLVKWQNGCVYRLTSITGDATVGQEETNTGAFLSSPK